MRQAKIEADDILKLLFYFIFFYFSEKISLDISCESSAKQMSHMKCQDLFSLKIYIKKFNISPAAVVIVALMVKYISR